MPTADQWQELIDALTLPPHIHTTVLTATDVVTGEPLAYPIMWADRHHTSCPECGEDIAVDVSCPVVLDPGAGQGGQLKEWSQQHGCGAWLSVDWRQLDTLIDPTAPEAIEQAEALASEMAKPIEAAAAERAAERDQRDADLRDKTHRRLARELQRALRALAEPLAEGETPQERIEEISTGSETEDGVYLDRQRQTWSSWDYDPTDPDGTEIIDVSSDTVSVMAAATMLGVTHQRVSALASEGKLSRDTGGVTVASVLARMTP